jgi:hypothetical protein
MLRAWHGVIGAAFVGAIGALVIKASAGARTAPGAADARGGAAARTQPGPAGPRVATPRAGQGSGAKPIERRPSRDLAGDALERRRGAAKANVWTVPHGDGWANKREGAQRVAKIFPTKAAAHAAGRVTAMREKVEHIILKQDGEIGERKSYGNDPPGSKG